MRVDWQGVFTALVTPFREDGSLDEAAYAALVKRQVEAGIHGLVPCGTTGEAPAMTMNEWETVIRIAVREAKGKATIVVGTGTNNTVKSIERTRRAHELGVDGALVITPYYNKPTPDGLVRHFSMIAEAVPEIPIMVYNVPGRTGVNLKPATAERLMEIPSIAAIKEASGDLTQIWDLIWRVGNELTVFSGEDGQNLPIWQIGGSGTVSVLSNIVPELVVKQWELENDGNDVEAYKLHRSFASLVSALFIETSPGPAKFALNQMGLPAGTVRPPLAPIRPESEEVILAVLRELSLVAS